MSRALTAPSSPANNSLPITPAANGVDAAMTHTAMPPPHRRQINIHIRVKKNPGQEKPVLTASIPSIGCK